MAEILILGAGPTGLMAAREAALAGHGCTVIEASDQVGGMAGSFEVAGQRVDFGSHRLHPASPPEILDLVADLLGPDLQERPRAGRLHLAGQWVGFPLRTTELLRVLPLPLTARLAADTGLTTLRQLRGPQGRGPAGRPGHRSFGDEVTARLGPTVTERFYGPYARKLYGMDPSELDAELARRRVSAGSPGDIVKRLAKAARPGGRTFLYPRRGYGQIVERLAESAADAGAEFRMSDPATEVKVGPDGVSVGTASARFEADVVLSTIAVNRLAQALQPAPPAEVVAALGRLRTRAMLLVYLVLDQPQYTEFDAHYIAGPETVVARLSEPKNYRDGDDPANTTVLCAEIACDPDDALTRRSPEELGAMVAEDLAALGLPRCNPIGIETRLLPSVYPVFDQAGMAARATVDEWVGGIDRVLSTGRQGLGVLDNLHHVLEMGRAAVHAVGPDGEIDRARWAASLQAFAANTVED